MKFSLLLLVAAFVGLTFAWFPVVALIGMAMGLAWYWRVTVTHPKKGA